MTEPYRKATANSSIPNVDSRFVCIVDREQVQLAAAISSYLYTAGTYLAVFGFPGIRHRSRPEAVLGDDDYISNVIASESAILISNALARMGASQHLILAGLSDAQKSYIRNPGEVVVIEIAGVDCVAEALTSIGILKREQLRCRPEQVLLGLYAAGRTGKGLLFDADADELVQPTASRAGLIIVEANLDNVSSVAAVNYALSIDASVKLVKPLGRDEARDVLTLIEKWKDAGESATFDAVIDKIRSRIGDVDFSSFEYTTFFTGGLPYSLLTGNVIPCSYVHLSNRTEQFLINNIVFERPNHFYSGIVFSLDEQFHNKGEGKWVAELLERNNYLVRELVGRSATVRNLDYNLQHFPFDILHIGSHGGEMDGYAVTQEFSDRDGNSHVVEYDEVVSFAPEPGRDLIPVYRKLIFRTLDSFRWSDVRWQNGSG